MKDGLVEPNPPGHAIGQEGAVFETTPSFIINHLLILFVPSLILFLPHRKNLNRDYEMSVLEEGDFDERVFLHPSANEEIGTPLAVGAHNFRSSLAAHTPPQHVQYGTPLLGREMLGTRDHRLTPASEATHHVSQLFLLLEGCRPEPSEYVRKLCSSCMANPLPELEGTVKDMGEKLVKESPPVRINGCYTYCIVPTLVIQKYAMVKVHDEHPVVLLEVYFLPCVRSC